MRKITDKMRLDWVLTPGHVLYQYDHGFWHAMNEDETNEEHGDRRARKDGRQAIDGAIKALLKKDEHPHLTRCSEASRAKVKQTLERSSVHG